MTRNLKQGMKILQFISKYLNLAICFKENIKSGNDKSVEIDFYQLLLRLDESLIVYASIYLRWSSLLQTQGATKTSRLM